MIYGLILALIGGIKVGDAPPAFRLMDQAGKTHALADYKGRWVAIAFYPKDMTSGCTVQNRSFTARMADFQKAGIALLAISTDGVDSHAKFCANDGLKHTLLADPSGKTAEAYGVRTEAGYAARTTFMIDPKGVVAAVFLNVAPAKSSDQILEFVQSRGTAPLTKGADFGLPGADGKKPALSEMKAEKGILIFFVSTTCPVCRAYESRMNAVAEEAKAKGFLVIGIDSNATEPAADVWDYAARMKFPVLYDEGSVVADLYRAKFTPEAFLLLPDRTIAYHGRIDNQMEEAQATTHELRDAVAAVAAGKPVAERETRPFGCTIKRPK